MTSNFVQHQKLTKKCLDSLFQNGWSSIQPSTKSVGDLVNGGQRVVQDTTDISAVKQSLDRNLIGEVEKKSASEDIIKEGMLESSK